MLCKNCKRSFHWGNLKNKQNQERIYFEQWIKEWYSVRQLTDRTKHSASKIYRILDYWIKEPTTWNSENKEICCYAIFDWTFLHRPNSIVAIINADKNEIVSGEYGVHENSEKEMYKFFNKLKEEWLSLRSCTVDGNPTVIKVLYQVWPEIIIQRCLVHIQRQGVMWCRKNPKRADTKKLREIFIQVPYIKTKQQRNMFLDKVNLWEQKFGFSINSKPEKGKVFSDLKRARSMLLNALPNMFHYLENNNIPNTTNAIEGYFSRLKRNYRNHRGLHPEKRYNYFRWFFHLVKK